MILVKNIKYTNSFIKIDLDTGESLRLSPEIFNMYSLAKEETIDNTLYQQLKEESIRIECRQKALDYLAISSHSYQEMRNYLRKKGFPRDIITEIIEGLKEKGYINDHDYAVRYIKAKKRSKIIGENLLKRDLYKKGINKEIIQKAIKETKADIIDPNDIYELALKKMKSMEKKKNKITKLIFFLKQKGFGEDEIRLVVDRFREDINL